MHVNIPFLERALRRQSVSSGKLHYSYHRPIKASEKELLQVLEMCKMPTQAKAIIKLELLFEMGFQPLLLRRNKVEKLVHFRLDQSCQINQTKLPFKYWNNERFHEASRDDDELDRQILMSGSIRLL